MPEKTNGRHQKAAIGYAAGISPAIFCSRIKSQYPEVASTVNQISSRMRCSTDMLDRAFFRRRDARRQLEALEDGRALRRRRIRRTRRGRPLLVTGLRGALLLPSPPGAAPRPAHETRSCSRLDAAPLDLASRRGAGVLQYRLSFCSLKDSPDAAVVERMPGRSHPLIRVYGAGSMRRMAPSPCAGSMPRNCPAVRT